MTNHLENFESTEGCLKNLKHRFPDKIPKEYITDVTLASLQGQQEVIRYIENMLSTLSKKEQK
jgi:hypothetical protein